MQWWIQPLRISIKKTLALTLNPFQIKIAEHHGIKDCFGPSIWRFCYQFSKNKTFNEMNKKPSKNKITKDFHF